MKIITAFLALLISLASFGTTKVVVANAGQGWSNGANFLPLGIPQNGDVVIIPLGTTISVKGNIYSTFPSLKISVYGNLDFDPSGRLSLANTSVIQLYDGSSITSNGTSSEQILIGGVIKYSGQIDGTIMGPKYASAGTANSDASVPGGGFAPGVLPIKLITFRATAESGSVRVFFTVKKDSDADRYIIQRNLDGSWNTIKEFKPTKSSPDEQSFSCHDQPFASGFVLYRLQMISVDGIITYSSIEKLNWKSKTEFSVFADPVSLKGFIRINTENDSRITIYNGEGKVELVKIVKAGVTVLDLNNLNIGPGFHLVQFIDGGSIPVVRRIQTTQ